jgi:hypothetical protein
MRSSLLVRRDKPGRKHDDPEDHQADQVRVFARHQRLLRSRMIPPTKKDKVVANVDAVQRAVKPSARRTPSSIPKTAMSTPASRIPSPHISATSRRSDMGAL